MMVRLYVGGLAPDVTADALQQRFVPFGAVQDCEVRPPKSGDTFCSPGSSCRGFGYVDLEVKDDAALRRCLSQYNGCKWRGRVLRVEPAKVSFLVTRKREREEDELAELEESIPQNAAASKDAHVLPFIVGKPLELVQPDGKPIATKPGKRKTHFPLTRTVPLEQLSWGALPTPSGAQRRAAAEALARAENERARVASHVASHAQEGDAVGADIAGRAAEDGNMAAGVPQETEEIGLKSATRKQAGRSIAKKKAAAMKEHSLSPAQSDSSDSLAAVDFVSAEETTAQNRPTTDLSRFEESDDDEPLHVGQPGKPAVKRRRGEDPSKADKASARKADVAAVVDQILAAKAKKEAKGLKTSKRTEKATASLHIPAAPQGQGVSSAIEASRSSATSSSSSASEPSSSADARQANATSTAARPADDPEAEALWAAQGGIDSYLAALTSEDDGPLSNIHAPESMSDGSEDAVSEQLAGSLSRDDEAGSEQMRGDSIHEEEADSEQQAESSEDLAGEDPGALWKAQGGLEKYLAALGRDSDAEPGAVDSPAEESKDYGDVSEQQQASSSDDAHIPAAADLSEDAGSVPTAQEGALDIDRDGGEALSSPAPDSLAEDEGFQEDSPAKDAAVQDGRLAEEEDLDDSLAEDGQDAGERNVDEEVQGDSADQQILLAADAVIEDALRTEADKDNVEEDFEDEPSGEGGGQAAEDAVVNSAFEGLDAGANFWAGGAGAEKLEAEWQKTREQLASSWKAKRRDALRHAQGGMAKKKRR